VHLAEGGSSDAPRGLVLPSLATNCALADPSEGRANASLVPHMHWSGYMPQVS
jgi:hypothetical protein